MSTEGSVEAESQQRPQRQLFRSGACDMIVASPMRTHRNRLLFTAGMRIALVLALCAAMPALAQNNAPKLTPEDYVEIMTLYAKYPLYLDSGNGEGYADLYTADGAFGDGVVGREALIEFAARRATNPSTVHHVHMTPVITPTAEEVNGTVMNFFIDVGANPPAITRASQYNDTLVKTADGWRFKKRVNGPVPGTENQEGGGRGGARGGGQGQN